MAILPHNDVTKEFNASGQNLDHLLHLEKVTPTEVVTKTVLSAFEEIQKSKLGWGHSAKKIFYPTAAYGGVLSLPIVGIVSYIWYFVHALKDWAFLSKVAIGGTTLAALLAADLAVGRVIGTRPITAILIAGYDLYREGAKGLSKQVRKSYENQEAQVNELIKQRHETIKTELKEAYKEMALALVKKHKAHDENIPAAIETLQKQLPLISKAFGELGLSAAEIVEILSPLQDALKLIPAAASAG